NQPDNKLKPVVSQKPPVAKEKREFSPEDNNKDTQQVNKSAPEAVATDMSDPIQSANIEQGKLNDDSLELSQAPASLVPNDNKFKKLNKEDDTQDSRMLEMSIGNSNAPEPLPVLPKSQPSAPSTKNDQPIRDLNNAKAMELSSNEKKPTALTANPTENEMKQSTSRTSQSSLSSGGLMSSSLCHITELSQPKPEALKLTLLHHRHLYGTGAEKTVHIERHLRALRNSPRNRPETSKPSKPMERDIVNVKRASSAMQQPSPHNKPCSDDDEDAPMEGSDRQAFDRFAANLFAELERKRASVNYEASKIMMPVELGYYRVAYDELVMSFGQPYHKCTLELYQQLAAELGLVAEMFVMDKTPMNVTSAMA
uniref:Uncharacterized protein n=1 Tax=Anopheles epiroticus TaxID=199890 RepID=A0A182PAT5_9DIPT